MAKVKIENRSTVTIHGLKPDGKIDVEIDREGTIINKHWRRRIADDDEAIVLSADAKKTVASLKKKVAAKNKKKEVD